MLEAIKLSDEMVLYFKKNKDFEKGVEQKDLKSCRIYQLCVDYWSQNTNLIYDYPKFLYKCTNLVQNYRDIFPVLSLKGLKQEVADRCYINYEKIYCSICKEKTNISCRSDFDTMLNDISNKWSKKIICENCKKSGKDIEEETTSIEKFELSFKHIVDPSKIIENKKKYLEECLKGLERFLYSMDNALYEFLSSIEFNFWLKFSLSEDVKVASRQLGVTNETGYVLAKKLYKKGLLYIDNKTRKLTLGNRREFVSNFTQKEKIKKLLSSPKEEDLYVKLRRCYLYVYPKVPIREFLDLDNIEHIITDNWMKNYLLSCNVDFLVCDNQMKPRFAVEYNGGYHEFNNTKDDLKKNVFAECGIPLYVFDYRDGNFEIKEQEKVENPYE